MCGEDGDDLEEDECLGNCLLGVVSWFGMECAERLKRTFSNARTHGGRTCRTMYFTLEYFFRSSGAVRGFGGVKVMAFAYAIKSKRGILSRTGAA